MLAGIVGLVIGFGIGRIHNKFKFAEAVKAEALKLYQDALNLKAKL